MNNNKAKIAVIGTKFLPFTGGLEKIMEEIGQKLVDDGFIVDVFVRKKYKKKKCFKSKYKGINRIFSKGFNSKHLDAITHSLTAILKIIGKNYNIVYINSIGLSVLGFIPKLFGMKVITQVHGLDFNREKWGKIASLFLKLSCYTTVWFSDKIICVSKGDKRYFENKFNTKCLYIENGVHFNELIAPKIIKNKYGLEKNSYILFMARLVKEKGCHYLLDAYENIKTDKKLVIAGDNNHYERYTEQLKNRQNKNIIFTGFVDGVIKQELFSNAYIYVLPSTLEAMPLSLLEAMSYRNFILCSDLPELIDILGDKGFYFKMGDSKDLEEKLKFILENNRFVMEQKNDIYKLAIKNHKWENIYPKYKKVINKLIF